MKNANGSNWNHSDDPVVCSEVIAFPVDSVASLIMARLAKNTRVHISKRRVPFGECIMYIEYYIHIHEVSAEL